MFNVSAALPKKMIEKKENDLIDLLLSFDDITERFDYIVDQKNLNHLIDEKYKIDENKVFGCQSDLWIIGELQNNRILFKYFSFFFRVHHLSYI